jgi:hypothetical protein
MCIYIFLTIGMYVLFTIKLLHKCFKFLCSILMPYWLGLCVLRRTCRQNRLYETLFHTVIILSKHHYHHHHQVCIANSSAMIFGSFLCVDVDPDMVLSSKQIYMKNDMSISCNLSSYQRGAYLSVCIYI